MYPHRFRVVPYGMYIYLFWVKKVHVSSKIIRGSHLNHLVHKKGYNDNVRLSVPLIQFGDGMVCGSELGNLVHVHFYS